MMNRYWLVRLLAGLSEWSINAAAWVAAKPLLQRVVLMFGWMG